LPAVLSAIEQDTDNTVFSYIPNTAETSFTVGSSSGFLNQRKKNYILENRDNLTEDSLQEVLSVKIHRKSSD
jgi:amidophosphoribosyltransferase